MKEKIAFCPQSRMFLQKMLAATLELPDGAAFTLGKAPSGSDALFKPP